MLQKLGAWVRWWREQRYLRHEDRCRFPQVRHAWRAPQDKEKFPVCVHCGKNCWYLRGYQLGLSGRWLGPDIAAQVVADRARIRSIPFMSRADGGFSHLDRDESTVQERPEMPPDLAARDYVIDICSRMKIEDHRIFDAAMLRAAWPPSGEADDTPAMGGITTAGELSALALAAGGHKAAPGYSTIDCLRANLGQDFRVYDRPLELGVEIHRVRGKPAGGDAEAR